MQSNSRTNLLSFAVPVCQVFAVLAVLIWMRRCTSGGGSVSSSQTPVLSPDEQIQRLDEPTLATYREMIVERMQSAYDIPPEETKAILEKTQGLPDSNMRRLFQIEYGIEIPQQMERLPTVVEDIPKFNIVNGRRTETTSFFKLSLSATAESRLINPYGWEFVITPPTGFPCEVEYNYYRDGRKTMTARFKNSKYYRVDNGRETEIQITDMPANDCLTLKLLPGVTGNKQFIIRRSRNYRI